MKPTDDAEQLGQADELRHLAAIEQAIIDANAQEQTLQVGAYKRTIKQRLVTFTCEWCSQESTELRYPGPTPLFHEACRVERQRDGAAARMRRMREKRAEQNPPRRGPGRPRKNQLQPQLQTSQRTKHERRTIVTKQRGT